MQATNQIPGRPSVSARTPLRQPSGDSSGSVRSADLLKGEKSVVIEHNGATYRLQATKLGKLILTK